MSSPVYQFAGLLVTGFRMTGRRNGPGLRIAVRTEAQDLDVEEARLLHGNLGRWLDRQSADGSRHQVSEA